MIIIDFSSENKFYVYVWFYKDSGKVFYVGKGTRHRYRSRKRDNKELVKILNSCDCDSKIIVDNLTEEKAFELEKEYISYYRNEGHPLINILDGGHMPPNALGAKRSELTKEKISTGIKSFYKNHPEASKIKSDKMKNFLKTEEGKAFQEKSILSRQNDDFKKR